jgi:hypothetical protein
MPKFAIFGLKPAIFDVGTSAAGPCRARCRFRNFPRPHPRHVRKSAEALPKAGQEGELLAVAEFEPLIFAEPPLRWVVIM